MSRCSRLREGWLGVGERGVGGEREGRGERRRAKEQSKGAEQRNSMVLLERRNTP